MQAYCMKCRQKRETKWVLPAYAVGREKFLGTEDNMMEERVRESRNP